MKSKQWFKVNIFILCGEVLTLLLMIWFAWYITMQVMTFSFVYKALIDYQSSILPSDNTTENITQQELDYAQEQAYFKLTGHDMQYDLGYTQGWEDAEVYYGQLFQEYLDKTANITPTIKEVPIIVTQNVTIEKMVYQDVYKSGWFFESTQQLQEWLDNHQDIPIIVFSDQPINSARCLNRALSYYVEAEEDGYILWAQLDAGQDHALNWTLIPDENKIVFINDGKIAIVYDSRTWTIYKK
jgi:hypothetical protein